MNILWIIYFIIGAIFGISVIYLTLHDEEIRNEEAEINFHVSNLGTAAIFVLTMIGAFVSVFIWPFLIVYALIKKYRREKNNERYFVYYYNTFSLYCTYGCRVSFAQEAL